MPENTLFDDLLDLITKMQQWQKEDYEMWMHYDKPMTARYIDMVYDYCLKGLDKFLNELAKENKDDTK